MNHRARDGRAHDLARGMGITEPEIERRKKIVGLEASDVPLIAALRDVVVQRADEFTAAFFDHLAAIDGARPLLADKALLEQAKALKKSHLLAMVSGDYGMTYAEQRLELAAIYAAARLDTRTFLGAFHHLFRTIGFAVVKQSNRPPLESFTSFMSLKKVAFFDIGLIVDALVFERERTIRQQADSIRELSTPVLQVRDRLLLLPIIGVIDTTRARQITESLLKTVRATRARAVVMDVTGVATIDSRVANHILQTVSAARLMGAEVIVTGLSSEVAHSLVALGIELSRLRTIGDLQGGLEEAERLLGYRLAQDGAPGAALPGQTAS
jgi:rsbT co-antagonist protein RsbR